LPAKGATVAEEEEEEEEEERAQRRADVAVAVAAAERVAAVAAAAPAAFLQALSAPAARWKETPNSCLGRRANQVPSVAAARLVPEPRTAGFLEPMESMESFRMY
jgi:hypothetical protein